MTSARAVFAVVLVTGCGDGHATGDAGLDGSSPDASPDAAATPLYVSCKEVQTAAVASTGVRPPDGNYTLYFTRLAEKPWVAYCRRMNLETPTEYIEVNPHANMSRISDGVHLAQTSYRRLRIDPLALTINPLDFSFTDNTGFDTFSPVMADPNWTAIPAGWAEFQPFRADDGPPAVSTIDLAGTPFAFHNTVLDNGLAFFCTVSSAGAPAGDDAGSGAVIAADLRSVQLSAITASSQSPAVNAKTREVAACNDLGPSSSFTSASWPLAYVGD